MKRYMSVITWGQLFRVIAWGKEVKKQVLARLNGFRKVSGVICDNTVVANVKVNVY